MDLRTLFAGSEIYVAPSIIAGEFEGTSWRYHRLDWRNQHVIWEHANKLISHSGASQLDFEAAVIQLQRAIEHRDRLLDLIYGFEKIPGEKGLNKYEVMADLQIIRPTLKVRLRELRNSLVHQPAPSALTRYECELLLDTAWYYLKVTDRITQQCADELLFTQRLDSKRSGQIKLEFQTIAWTAKVQGNLHPDFLLNQPSNACLSVRLGKCEVNYDGDLTFYGETTGTDAALGRIIRLFFDESVL